jgi:hypothetical protein
MTGIAGAQDHQPARPQRGCIACGATFEASHAARALPGIGIAEACSKACAQHPRFRARLVAESVDAPAPGDGQAAIDAAVEAERAACEEAALNEHLAAIHDLDDDGNQDLVARLRSQGAAEGAARILAVIRARRQKPPAASTP